MTPRSPGAGSAASTLFDRRNADPGTARATHTCSMDGADQMTNSDGIGDTRRALGGFLRARRG
ncbi:MAG: hypothetical protein WCD21_41115, partial [Streptomyces sp.]